MKNNIPKILLGIIVIPALAVLVYFGYLFYLAPKPPETLANPETEEVETRPTRISAEGKVLPDQYAQLRFKAPGLIEEVLVEQGDHIEKGQVIAKLEGHDQVEASITAAQLELISAEQNLNDLYVHIRLRRAQAQQAVIDAQDQVNEAERIVSALSTPASKEQIEAAEEAVSVAENTRKTASKALERFLDESKGNPTRLAAQVALSGAERRYQVAVNTLNALKSQPGEEQIAKAETNLEIAQAYLEEAERELKILEDGPHPDEVALAEARKTNAEAQMAAAKAALEDLSLLAPFSGKIITLNLKAGEVVDPSVPSAILADLSDWHVETTDLTEIDVSQISPGMEAIITLNAFPNETFTGAVEEIDLQGVERRGTVNYTVRLDFNPRDIPLRMEMSAFVEILLP